MSAPSRSAHKSPTSDGQQVQNETKIENNENTSFERRDSRFRVESAFVAETGNDLQTGNESQTGNTWEGREASIKRKEAEIKRKEIQNEERTKKRLESQLSTVSIRSERMRERALSAKISVIPDSCQPVKPMSRNIKYVTTAVLYFCYFALAINDYIFGPTLHELSNELHITFATVSLFPTIRQFAYTCGGFGGFAFNYINRQLCLIALLILSSATLIMTPLVNSASSLFIMAGINGFAAGAADIGFHVWILEMFNGDGSGGHSGGTMLQALHFAFGIGTIVAPLITGPFLSEAPLEDTRQYQRYLLTLNTTNSSNIMVEDEENLLIPYLISAIILFFGAACLLVLFFVKKYRPPLSPEKEATQDQKVQETTSKKVNFDNNLNNKSNKFLKTKALDFGANFKSNLPDGYSAALVGLGCTLLFFYYGLEVTTFQFVAPFVDYTDVPIYGSGSALVESGMAAAYAIGGFLSIFLSIRLLPQQMIYVNFAVIDIGALILLFGAAKDGMFLWVGVVLVGFGYSSTYATAYTFLEHHVTVTNTVGSFFMLSGGLGTAVFPLLIGGQLSENSMVLVYLCLCCTQISVLVFALVHVMTTFKKKTVGLERTGSLILRPRPNLVKFARYNSQCPDN